MSDFDVLIHLRRCASDVAALRAGFKLAARLDAHVSGLQVVGIAPAAFASPEAVALQVREADDLYREAQAKASWWHEQLQAHGLDGEWQVAQGDTVEALCHASRWNDMLVLERPTLNPDAPTGWGVVSRTVFGASAPIVVVPETARVDHVGEHVVVAWNESREAALALRGALPLLRRANRVSVLVGEPSASPFGLRYLPRLDLRGWCERHRIDATFEIFHPEHEPGPALLEAAHRLDADLIVMGAWGHSRISELVLGGSTRHLFQHSDLPLLVAH